MKETRERKLDEKNVLLKFSSPCTRIVGPSHHRRVSSPGELCTNGLLVELVDQLEWIVLYTNLSKLQETTESGVDTTSCFKWVCLGRFIALPLEDR